MGQGHSQHLQLVDTVRLQPCFGLDQGRGGNWVYRHHYRREVMWSLDLLIIQKGSVPRSGQAWRRHSELSTVLQCNWPFLLWNTQCRLACSNWWQVSFSRVILLASLRTKVWMTSSDASYESWDIEQYLLSIDEVNLEMPWWNGYVATCGGVCVKARWRGELAENKPFFGLETQSSMSLRVVSDKNKNLKTVGKVSYYRSASHSPSKDIGKSGWSRLVPNIYKKIIVVGRKVRHCGALHKVSYVLGNNKVKNVGASSCAREVCLMYGPTRIPGLLTVYLLTDLL